MTPEEEKDHEESMKLFTELADFFSEKKTDCMDGVRVMLKLTMYTLVKTGFDKDKFEEILGALRSDYDHILRVENEVND